MIRWRIAIMVAIAIAINYLDRLTLPSVVDEIKKTIPFDDQSKALLDSAFLAAYGLMYLVGGKMMDLLGTRKGFAIIIVFWSLACASHGFAAGFVGLAICRLLLGVGEGGGFPAATRAVTEWFPVKERSTAMGIINGATGVGGMAALPLISLLLYHTGWFGILPWRWVFFITGSFGIVWLLWWMLDYSEPEKHKGITQAERDHIHSGIPAVQATQAKIPLSVLFEHRETWGIVVAKFLTDAAWYFILFWMPKYLNGLHPPEEKYSFAKTASVAWIPHAAAFVGCLLGGSLSSYLIKKNFGVDAARKLALFCSAIVMPALILVPYTTNTALVITLFAVGYFGQQSWSTLVMVLPTDLFPKRAVGTVAGLVGLGGAMGGIALGQFSSYLLDHKFTYKPVMLIAGLLHVTAFLVILIVVRKIRPLELAAEIRSGSEAAFGTLKLALKVQIPAILIMLLGLIVVQCVMDYVLAHKIVFATPAVAVHHWQMIGGAAVSLVVAVGLLLAASKRKGEMGIAIASALLALTAMGGKFYFVSDHHKWNTHQAFASCCVAVSILADLVLLISALTFLTKRPGRAESAVKLKVAT